MLVLGRRQNERVLIEFNGVHVWVTVAEIQPSRVKLGFEAPPGVRIAREEIAGSPAKEARPGDR